MDWPAIAAIAVSIGALVISGLTFWQAKRSADATVEAAEASKSSAITAQGAVEQARRSADAAPESLELQRREAEALEHERQLAKKAKLIVHNWHGSTGLKVENLGRGDATNVWAVLNWPKRYADLAAIAADDTRDLSGRLFKNGWPADFSPSSDPAARQPGDEDVAYLSWSNEDGTQDELQWVPVPKLD